MRLHRIVSFLAMGVALAAANLAYSSSGTWSSSTTRLQPQFPFTDYPLREHASVFDPKRNRVLVFGGQTPLVQNPYSNELWSLGFDVSPGAEIWQKVADCQGPCLRPSPRTRASMIYDLQTDRILVFGGYNPNQAPTGQLWKLDLSFPNGWESLNVGSGGPSGSTADIDVRAVHDTARRRLLVISPTQGVYAVGLSGGDWTQIYSGSLETLIGGYGYSSVYDSNSDRLLIFGGRKNTGSNLCADEYGSSTVYALSFVPGSSWQPIATGAPAVADGAVTFDRDANRVLLYGGERCRSSAGGIPQFDPHVWELSLNAGGYTWRLIQPSGPIPPSRFSHSLTMRLDRRLYVFGGTDGTTNFATAYKLQPTDPPVPEARARHVTVYDPIRQRMILWGGDDGQRLFSQDVWAMSLQTGAAPSWSKLNVSVQGSLPAFGTRGAAAAFDTRRGVMYVQGGAPALSTSPVASLLQLSFPNANSAVWSMPVIVSGDPGSRMFHSMAYDSVGDQVYLFGGWDGLGTLGDTKRMTPTPQGVQWDDVAASPAPEARCGYVSYFDTKRRRFTIMGGEGSQYGGSTIGPVWGLTVSGSPTWATINSFGGPGGLWFGSAAYRNYGDRAYLSGGWFDPVNVWSNEQTWIHWLFDDPVSQSGWGGYAFANAPTNHVYQNTSIFDRLGNRVITFGGSVFSGYQQTHPYDRTPTNVINLSHALATTDWAPDSYWTQIAPYQGAGNGNNGSGGGGGGGNHSASSIATSNVPGAQVLVSGGLGSSSFRFRVEGSVAALRVDIFDVHGRLVRRLKSSGTADVTWNRLDQNGLKVAQGVYAYRAVAGNVSRTGKLILTR